MTYGKPGLYRIFWKDGGSSIGAIGMHSDGSNWIAPTNWVSPAKLDAARESSIANVELIVVTSEDEDRKIAPFYQDAIKLEAIKNSLAIDIDHELDEATRKHGGFNSAHEGYAVLLEEVEELWDEVKKKRSLRDKSRMRSECVQIAAMAIKFHQSLCEE